MVRWTYLLPRLMIVVLLLIGLEYGVGPLLKWTLPFASRKARLADIEIDGLHLGLVSGRIDVRSVVVGRRVKDRSYSVHWDRMVGQVDRQALVHGQWHIDRLKMTGLRWDERESLADVRDEAGSMIPAADWMQSRGREVVADWTSLVASRLGDAAYEQLETVRVARELRGKWETELDRQEERLRRWKFFADQLQQRWDAARTPAKRLKLAGELALQAGEIRGELEGAVTDTRRLEEDWLLDRRRLDQAQQRDRDKLSQVVGLRQVDPRLLGETLLGERLLAAIERATEGTRWIRYGLGLAVKKPKWNELVGRGVDYEFDVERGPDVWIRRFDFDASWQHAAGRRHVVGTAHNLTNDREKLGRPTEVRWRMTSGLPIEGEWVLEVPGGELIERWRIEVEPWGIKQETWGGVANAELQVAELEGRLWLEMQRSDEGISGTCVVDFTSGEADFVVGIAGEKLSVPIAIGERSPMKVVVKWRQANRWSAPELDIASDLGERLAAPLRDAALARIADHSDRLSATAEKERSRVMGMVESRLLEQSKELERVTRDLTKWKKRMSAWLPYGTGRLGVR